MKIFGLGLSKTGTSSLTVALSQLGYRAIHNPTDDATLQALLYGNLSCEAVLYYDALCDIMFVRYFRELARLFEDSRFILTVRDRKSWLNSCAAHWANRGATIHDLANEDLIDFGVYGTTRFHPRLFSDVYDQHVRAVQRYFSETPNRLLTLNICGGDGWTPLCSFLKCPQPAGRFPHICPQPWARTASATTPSL